MKTPAEIRDWAAKRFKSRRAAWLAEALGAPPETEWPQTVSLGMPSERTVLTDPDRVLRWRDAWVAEREKGVRGIAYEDTVRLWRTGGTQTVPERAVFESADEVARVAGQGAIWQQALGRARRLLDRWPGIGLCVSKEWALLADWSDLDFEALIRVIDWFIEHPKSGLYLRQLPVEGVDTKWFAEARQKLIVRLLHAVRTAAGEAVSSDDAFEAVCGLRRKPVCVRLRLLDPKDSDALQGLSDVTAPVSELVRLPLRPETVYVSENEQSGLAFEPEPGAVVFFGLGNSAPILAEIPWVREAKVIYWGDVDTYGLAILAHVRRVLPQTRSVLMDEATLAAHVSLTVEEVRQSSEMPDDALTADERALWEALRVGTYGIRRRLEQERLPWATVREALQRARAH